MGHCLACCAEEVDTKTCPGRKPLPSRPREAAGRLSGQSALPPGVGSPIQASSYPPRHPQGDRQGISGENQGGKGTFGQVET